MPDVELPTLATAVLLNDVILLPPHPLGGLARLRVRGKRDLVVAPDHSETNMSGTKTPSTTRGLISITRPPIATGVSIFFST